jgi:hypothetical protein
MANGWPKGFNPSEPRWPDMEKNKELWKKTKQTCVNCKKKIPNPMFYDHITKTCPKLQRPYIDEVGLSKILGLKMERKK